MNSIKNILSTITKPKALLLTEMSGYDTQIQFLAR